MESRGTRSKAVLVLFPNNPTVIVARPWKWSERRVCRGLAKLFCAKLAMKAAEI